MEFQFQPFYRHVKYLISILITLYILFLQLSYFVHFVLQVKGQVVSNSIPARVTPYFAPGPQADIPSDVEEAAQLVFGTDFLERYMDVGENNLIIQNGTGFTLAEGQEYELIGETEPSPQQRHTHTFQQFGNETYEVVEVDDQTMAQLAANNGGMFLPDASNLQVTQFDANDPNIQNLIKVLTPEEFYEQVSS